MLLRKPWILRITLIKNVIFTCTSIQATDRHEKIILLKLHKSPQMFKPRDVIIRMARVGEIWKKYNKYAKTELFIARDLNRNQ